MTNNPDWERAWSAAVHLYAHLSSGGQPQPMITPLRLFPGEEAFSDLPLTYSRFYEMDVTYERSSGFFFGSPLFIAVGLAANAASNAAAKNRAARMAAPQWREHCLARAVVTNYRTMCFVQGRWLTFDHNAVVEFTADPPRAACLMTFDSAEPLCLAGYGAPWLAVLIAYFLHGPERLPYLPYLAPLAPNQLPGTGAGELSG